MRKLALIALAALMVVSMVAFVGCGGDKPAVTTVATTTKAPAATTKAPAATTKAPAATTAAPAALDKAAVDALAGTWKSTDGKEITLTDKTYKDDGGEYTLTITKTETTAEGDYVLTVKVDTIEGTFTVLKSAEFKSVAVKLGTKIDTTFTK